MEYIKGLFANITVRRFFILFLICLLLFSLRGMLDIILLTFVLGFVLNSLASFITRKVKTFIRINYNIVLIAIYGFIIVSMIIGISNLLPKIVWQVKQITDGFVNLYNLPLESYTDYDNYFFESLLNALESLDLQLYVKQGLGYLLMIGNWGKILFLSLLFSFFLLLEKSRIKQFTAKFKTSKISWFYTEVEYFSIKFVSSFGKVIEAQILIAITNTVLTTIGLWIMGFPYLFVLSLMVFALSLIPVAGVVISLIPLSLIALQMGGFLMVAYVIIMILVVHAIESYFLNPKFMSSKTKLPLFYAFVILIFSEHYLGIWGLIIGIPIFLFLLDILDFNKPNDEERLS